MKILELVFLKELVSSEQEIRDNGVTSYLEWINSPQVLNCSDQDLLKVWKSLYLSLWVQDKPILQQALSDKIAESVLSISNDQVTLRFIRSFWLTIVREWSMIDRHRLDKYYYLIKGFLLSSFKFLDKSGWNIEYCKSISTTLYDVLFDVPGERTPDSLKYFVCEYFVELFLQAIGNELQPSVELIGALFDCFFRYSVNGIKQVVHNRIGSNIFNALYPSNETATSIKISQDLYPQFGQFVMENYVDGCRNKIRKQVLVEFANRFGVATDKMNTNGTEGKKMRQMKPVKEETGHRDENECIEMRNGFRCSSISSSKGHSHAEEQENEPLSFEPNTPQAWIRMRRSRIVPWVIQSRIKSASVTSSPSQSNLLIRKSSPSRDSPRIKWGCLLTKEFSASLPVSQVSLGDITESEIN